MLGAPPKSMDEEKRKTCSWRERVEMKTKGREIEKTALLFSELQKEKKNKLFIEGSCLQ